MHDLFEWVVKRKMKAQCKGCYCVQSIETFLALVYWRDPFTILRTIFGGCVYIFLSIHLVTLDSCLLVAICFMPEEKSCQRGERLCFYEKKNGSCTSFRLRNCCEKSLALCRALLICPLMRKRHLYMRLRSGIHCFIKMYMFHTQKVFVSLEDKSWKKKTYTLHCAEPVHKTFFVFWGDQYSYFKRVVLTVFSVK